MKFCVFGAGAVGGFVGGMVARGYADVSSLPAARICLHFRPMG